jgi:hypothetical protein
MAMISYRRNSIAQILNENGVWVQDHEGKVGLLWSAFRNRIGVSTNPAMLFDLPNLIEPVDGLQDLAEPFQQSEIDLIVRRMPSDKAPGPDGFNGLFMKRCWQIIKSDFYKLCQDFYMGTTNLECIKTSFITLVPKIDSPKIVSDYRPISLMNISLKLITKIMADHLQAVIIQLIHRNQYSFIKTRTIQD